jgi:hypothetical protein
MIIESNKEIIFFILFFIFTILSVIATEEIYNANKVYKMITIVVISLISTIILFVIYKLYKNKEGFHFEVTPQKSCEGGSYMHQTNKMCQKMWNTPQGKSDLATYNCLSGYCNGKGDGLFKGRPLNIGYRQDLSDDHWQNKLCNGNFLEEDKPMVL